MQISGDLPDAALPFANGECGDSQDTGKLTLTIVIFLSPLLEIDGTHRGKYILKEYNLSRGILEIVHSSVVFNPGVHISPVDVNASAVFDIGDLPGPKHLTDCTDGPTQIACRFRDIVKTFRNL